MLLLFCKRYTTHLLSSSPISDSVGHVDADYETVVKIYRNRNIKDSDVRNLYVKMNKIEDIISKPFKTVLVFFVNGKKVVEESPDPEWTLLWYLRKKLHLTGTKYGCGEGGCGACTVMVSQYIRDEDRVKHFAVNACLTPVCAMHGFAVITVEGIGSTESRLHPVQERLAKAHGSQCGFCTPGIIMSMYALLRDKNKIDYNDIETALQGNLCRCTGYRPIIEGFKTFIEGWEQSYLNGVQNGFCTMGENCCKMKTRNNEDKPKLFKSSEFQPHDPTQEPIFPPELKLKNYDKFNLLFRGKSVVWFKPTTLKDLLALKKVFPSSKIIAGNTEIGVEIKFKNRKYPILISPVLINEMNICDVDESGIRLGAAKTLSEILNFLLNEIKKDIEKTKVFEAIKDMLHWFAGNQIRNVATIVGNVITASPISDLNPILLASASKLHVVSCFRGHREIQIDSNFFTGYRKVALEEDEVVTSIEIPFTKKGQYFKAYKQARRRDDDISIVTAAFNVTFEEETNVVKEAKLCFGGMAPTTICAIKSSQSILGMQWDKKLLNVLFDSLTQELELNNSAPGGMVEYRKSLCLSLFFRFYLYVSQELPSSDVDHSALTNQTSGVQEIGGIEPKSTQCFELKCNSTYDAVGQPIVHTSALKQVTGEAIYCDDIPTIEGELYLSLVFSTESHAKIISVDASEALSQPDVVAFFSAVDLPEACNKMGPIFKDEEIFASKVVTSRSCVIGAIVAKSENAAKKAKHFVSVIYEPLEPVVVTIEDAIKHNSFFAGFPRKVVKGDIEEAFKNAEYIKEGYIRSGAQEHFYLETISAFAIRREDELEIISTTQNPADIAHIASETLRIPNHKIVGKVKRIGGGFGGKETRAALLALPVAIAAYKLKEPVRAVLERDEDMQVTGYRHPFLTKYKVAFDRSGKISGVIYNFYANAGNYMDISCTMIDRALNHIENCYFIPNIEINAYLCKTNIPSNTAFRGFGAPKAMLAAECMIRDIATQLNKDYEEVASINLYKEGDFTHYNQKLTYCTLSRCWNECLETANYKLRKAAVKEFNRCNRWKKKGISLVPTKYGISFQNDTLMQGGALLMVYADGSVLLSIGGIEMGQGLFTKMTQVASKALGVDISKIYISEMATDKVPNSSPTAASVSSDLYGMAVLNACNTLMDRIAPYKTAKGKWEDWVSAAYVDRVNLSATGFYAAPKMHYNPNTNSMEIYEYFTYGVACSEVLVDCLTGDHQVLRTDIVMDIGESLNPAIDIGQIEGAFMQGYGFYTLEEVLFAPSGEVLTKGPGTYKIPGFSDIPKEFNVSLLKGAPNPRAVYSSKAVGEPPLFLAASVFFAIKEAIASARSDFGASSDFVLEAPATCARIRMACEDEITQQVKPSIKPGGKPWNVLP